MVKPRLRVVLVRSLFDSNIGATSRAMANMGVDDLILIAPQTEIGEAAKKAAATGQGPLTRRRVYSSWAEFSEKEELAIRFAFTARDGRGRQAHDFASTFRQVFESRNPPLIDLVFGPENWGLANEDVDQCHHAVSIPTFGENPSLNLAQATLLALFITQSELKAPLGHPKAPPQDEDLPGHLPEDLVVDWIRGLGFDLSDRRINVHATLRRLFMHAVPTRKESAALQVVLQQSKRKMEEYHQMRRLLGLEQDGQPGRPLSDLLQNPERKNEDP